jgi:hypothetical protein
MMGEPHNAPLYNADYRFQCLKKHEFVLFKVCAISKFHIFSSIINLIIRIAEMEKMVHTEVLVCFYANVEGSTNFILDER